MVGSLPGRAPRAATLRPRADERDELASFQLIELQSVPASQAGLQDIELGRISQGGIYKPSAPRPHFHMVRLS